MTTLTSVARAGESDMSAHPPRAMWAWQVVDPVGMVADAQRRGVGEIYAGVTYGVAGPGELGRLTTLSNAARDAGILVYALGGDPAWTTDYRSALAWQQAALATGLFDGTHVDIEPWALPAWSNPAKRPRLVKSWEATLKRMRGASALPMHVDVPFWAHEIHSASGGTMAEAAARQAHLLVVMSYRDTSSGVLDVGTPMLAVAHAAGRPVRLAVETLPLADCSYCTFAGRSVADLDLALDEIDSAAAALTPQYAGVTVHDDGGWAALEAAG